MKGMETFKVTPYHFVPLLVIINAQGTLSVDMATRCCSIFCLDGEFQISVSMFVVLVTHNGTRLGRFRCGGGLGNFFVVVVGKRSFFGQFRRGQFSKRRHGKRRGRAVGVRAIRRFRCSLVLWIGLSFFFGIKNVTGLDNHTVGLHKIFIPSAPFLSFDHPFGLSFFFVELPLEFFRQGSIGVVLLRIEPTTTFHGGHFLSGMRLTKQGADINAVLFKVILANDHGQDEDHRGDGRHEEYNEAQSFVNEGRVVTVAAVLFVTVGRFHRRKVGKGFRRPVVIQSELGVVVRGQGPPRQLHGQSTE
mmetsp:Transcript_28162/g.46661  ORF Transcript_28162/g.46661 Transcript_28162/m.46661 type:complete len:304 (+) Transcript_28162:411-1322(+)